MSISENLPVPLITQEDFCFLRADTLLTNKAFPCKPINRLTRNALLLKYKILFLRTVDSADQSHDGSGHNIGMNTRTPGNFAVFISNSHISGRLRGRTLFQSVLLILKNGIIQTQALLHGVAGGV